MAASLQVTGGILGRVPQPTADTLAEVLRPVTEDPGRSAVLLDVDGVLAPIVERAQDAHVPEKTSRLLGSLVRRYGLVACVSGRAALDTRRLVGVGGISYAGSHGAELLEPNSSKPTVLPAFETWTDRVRAFVADRDERDLRRLRVRIEDKGPIQAFHWRGAPDEDEARTRVEEIAQEAESDGFLTHWGRKVLEVRPPVPVNKGQAVEELLRRVLGVRVALYAGDDATDLDAWDALDRLLDEGRLDARVRVGVASDEGPPKIVERADVAVDGPRGFTGVLEVLAS
jgi:trehalose 6-phosphate phosphatase